MSHKKWKRTPEHSPRREPECKCPCGKKAYATRKLAAAAMVAAIKRLGEAREDWNYYRCLSGSGHWHIGHATYDAEKLNRPPRPRVESMRISHRYGDVT